VEKGAFPVDFDNYPKTVFSAQVFSEKEKKRGKSEKP